MQNYASVVDLQGDEKSYTILNPCITKDKHIPTETQIKSNNQSTQSHADTHGS